MMINPVILSKRKFFVLLLAISSLACFTSVYAATVDTATTYSTAMKKNIKAVVILPNGYVKTTAYPVVYLLHGYSGNYADWVTKVPGVTQLADKHNLIIVCPDGNFGSWYYDSPVENDWRYETYVAKELVNYIDDRYATIKDRRGRAITGLSMGGHGAFYLAFRNQEVFGAAGSMSGGVDIRPFPNNWDLARRLGSYSTHPENWEKNTVANMLYLLTPGSLSIIFDCGTGDFFYGVNKALHEQMLERNIPHDFIVRPGVHNWEYWANAVQYQMLYFSNYFHLPAGK